jgi:hypothetical protein
MDTLDKLNAMGGWPLMMPEGTWNESKWTWEQSVKSARANGFGFDLFFSFETFFDSKNSKKRDIWVRTEIKNYN